MHTYHHELMHIAYRKVSLLVLFTLQETCKTSHNWSLHIWLLGIIIIIIFPQKLGLNSDSTLKIVFNATLIAARISIAADRTIWWFGRCLWLSQHVICRSVHTRLVGMNCDCGRQYDYTFRNCYLQLFQDKLKKMLCLFYTHIVLLI